MTLPPEIERKVEEIWHKKRRLDDRADYSSLCYGAREMAEFDREYWCGWWTAQVCAECGTDSLRDDGSGGVETDCEHDDGRITRAEFEHRRNP